MEKFLVEPNTSIVDVLKQLEALKEKVVYVVANKKVLGSITDGDVRRYALNHSSMEGVASDVMHTPCNVCRSISEGQHIIEEKQIANIPLVNEAGEFLDLVTKEVKHVIKPVRKEFENVKVIMMAGGKGERLYPYTSVLPKPLIPINGIPIAERILRNFAQANLKNYIISLNYKRNLIKTYFDDALTDCNFEYVVEDEPLGTGGSLRLMEDKVSDVFIIINCDMLIDIDLDDLLAKHKESKSLISVVSGIKNIQIPYGVFEMDGNRITSMIEKPTIQKIINTGMYVVSKEALKYMPETKKFHMTDLCAALLEKNLMVTTYTIDEEKYLDMGVMSELKNMSEKVA